MLRRSIARTLGWITRFGARTALLAGEDPRCRRRLGQLHTLLRQAAHENYVTEVRSRYELHPTVAIAPGTFLYGDGRIQVGEGTYFGRQGFIAAEPAEARIDIGRSCAISHSVHIRTATYRATGDFADSLGSPLDWQNIEIGDFVWIGAHVYVRGGVTLGNNSVIGANSVVTANVAPGSVVGGVPARRLRSKEELTS